MQKFNCGHQTQKKQRRKTTKTTLLTVSVASQKSLKDFGAIELGANMKSVAQPIS